MVHSGPGWTVISIIGTLVIKELLLCLVGPDWSFIRKDLCEARAKPCSVFKNQITFLHLVRHTPFPQ